jgi:hemerythrin-like domain-containing protein
MKGNAKHKNGSKKTTSSSAPKLTSEKTKSPQAHNDRGMDATDLLIKDHENVQDLFAQAERAGEDAQKKAMLFAKIRDELQIHTRIEEEIFYPAVADLPVDRAKDDIERSLQDHEEVDDLLDDLEMLSPDDSDFDERMAELMDAVRKHIKLEQEEVFKVARTGLGEEKLQELGREMEQLRESLKEQKMDSEGAEASE